MKLLQRFNLPGILQSCRRTAFASALLLGIGMSAVTVVLGAGNGNGNSSASSFALAGNRPGFIAKATDLGSVDPNTVIAVTVWLRLHNEAQLDNLVTQQQQRGSGQYHNWITQDQFNASFGPTSQELNSVQNYLNAKGLSTVFVAENNMFVKVQGTVASIQNAFHVQIHKYNFAGKTYRSRPYPRELSDCEGARHIE